MTAERLNDAQLLRTSELFDEEFYLRSHPEVAESGLEGVRHYLRVGWLLGFDPSPEFSTQAYLDANHDVAQRKVNPLVHYLRMGRVEGRELNPLIKLSALITESGLFDPDYYRHFHPELLPEVDAAQHFLMNAARTGADPSEQFSTSEYLRNYADVAAGSQNPLVHYLRHGRKEKRSIWPGRARYPRVRDALAEQWPALSALPFTAVPGTAPRVTVIIEDVDSFELPGGLGVTLALAVQIASAAGGSVRLVTRDCEPDAAILRAAAVVNGAEVDCQIELDRLLPGGDHSLPLRSSDLVVVSSWKTATAAIGSTLRPEQLLWVLQDDPAQSLTGDELVWCTQTLATTPLAVLSRRLRAHLSQRGDVLVRTELDPGVVPLGSNKPAGGPRRLLCWAGASRPTDAFWLAIEVLSTALEEGRLDPERWQLTLLGPGTAELTLPRGVRPEVVTSLPCDEDVLAPLTGYDAAMVMSTTPSGAFPVLDLLASGIPVLALAAPWAIGDHQESGLIVRPTQRADLLDGLDELLQRAEGTSAVEAGAQSGAQPGGQPGWPEALREPVAHLVAHGRDHLGWEVGSGVR